MLTYIPQQRSIKQLLREKRGVGLAESLVGITLIVMIVSAIGITATQDMGVVGSVASKAERQALVTTLVGDQHSVGNWGTAADPNTEDLTLPNGHDVVVTTWREDDATSTRLNAVTPSTAGPDAADCTGPADIAKTGCVYASRLHADDLDSLEPFAIIRADPSGGTTAGTVDPHISTDVAIPQGTTFASGQDDKATVWRYLINARSMSDGGEIRIVQTGKTLAVIPVDDSAQNYFGTFTVKLNTPVTAIVTSGSVVVKTVYIYRAGSTS